MASESKASTFQCKPEGGLEGMKLEKSRQFCRELTELAPGRVQLRAAANTGLNFGFFKRREVC
jgi:hypothetical protein